MPSNNTLHLDNHILNNFSSEDATRRQIVHYAVREQIAADGKRPWDRSQKLKDAPYRYTIDELRQSLLALSNRLGDLGVLFKTGQGFMHPTYETYGEFVRKMRSSKVKDLILAVHKASRQNGG